MQSVRSGIKTSSFFSAQQRPVSGPASTPKPNPESEVLSRADPKSDPPKPISSMMTMPVSNSSASHEFIPPTSAQMQVEPQPPSYGAYEDSDDELINNLSKHVVPQQSKPIAPSAPAKPKASQVLFFSFPRDRTKNNPLEGFRVRVLGTSEELSSPDEFHQLLRNMGAEITLHLDKSTNLVIYGLLKSSAPSQSAKPTPKAQNKARKGKQKPANPAKPKIYAPEKDIVKFKEFSDESDQDGGPSKTTGVGDGLTPFTLRNHLDHPEIKTALSMSIPVVSEPQFMMSFYNTYGANPIQNNNANPNLIGKVRPREQASVLLSDNPGRMWVDIFAPKTSADIIGNSRLKESLEKYLREFHIHKNEKSFARAVLLAGPPGIGKTTAAKVIATELGFRTVVQNASDSRNKSDVARMVGTLKNNTVLNKSFVTASESCVLIMDEVDGMTGDHGGIAALIEQIRESQIPIVCICNDSGSPKIRSLIPHCKVLRFQEPTITEIEELLKRIVAQIGDDEMVTKMIDYRGLAMACNGDLRQCLVNLQFEVLSNPNSLQVTGSSTNHDKDLGLTAPEATQRLIDGCDPETLNFKRMKQLFFTDFKEVPTHVFENYLSKSSEAKAACTDPASDLLKVDAALESMMFGDQLSRRIAENADFELLDAYSVASTLAPLAHMWPLVERKISAFPMIWARISSINKRNRLFRELRERFGKLVGGLSNQMVVLMVIWAMVYVTDLSRKMLTDLVNPDEVFNQIFEMCIQLDLDQVVLKEHFEEVAKIANADKLNIEFQQFLKEFFLNRFKERWGTDGVVGKAGSKGVKAQQQAEDQDTPNEEAQESENPPIEFETTE